MYLFISTLRRFRWDRVQVLLEECLVNRTPKCTEYVDKPLEFAIAFAAPAPGAVPPLHFVLLPAVETYGASPVYIRVITKL